MRQYLLWTKVPICISFYYYQSYHCDLHTKHALFFSFLILNQSCYIRYFPWGVTNSFPGSCFQFSMPRLSDRTSNSLHCEKSPRWTIFCITPYYSLGEQLTSCTAWNVFCSPTHLKLNKRLNHQTKQHLMYSRYIMFHCCTKTETEML